MPLTERQEQLRHRTAEAARPSAGSSATSSPCAGNLLVLRRHPELDVEWLVVEPHPDARDRLLLVPADTNPLAGSADVVVPATVSAGPLTLRCGYAAWSDQEALIEAGAEVTGELPAEWCGRAHRRHRDLLTGSLKARSRERETDADPEYEVWATEVVEPARSVLAALDPPRKLPVRRRLAELAGPLAAGLALIALAEAAWIWIAEERWSRIEPVVISARAEVAIGGEKRGPIRLPEAESQENLLLFIIPTDTAKGYPAYTVGLEIANEGEVWTSAPRPLPDLGELTVAIPRRRLRGAAKVEVVLRGEKDGEVEELGRRVVVVRPP